jgi:CRP-like cAMP-binding protein
MEALNLLRKSDLFSVLPAPELKKLAEKCEVRLVESGSLLVRAGATHAAVVYLAQGKVALYRRNPKRDVTLLLGVVEAPSLFGDAECAAETHWMCSVKAEEDSWCVLIPNAAFLACVDKNAVLASKLYRDASIRHLLANHTAQTLALYDVETRLLRLLLDYGYRFGRQVADTVVIDKPISQVEMAAALGVKRKTIGRTFLPLEKQGTITRNEDGSLVIHRLSKLEAALPRDLFGLSSRHGEKVSPVTQRWAADAVATAEALGK